MSGSERNLPEADSSCPELDKRDAYPPSGTSEGPGGYKSSRSDDEGDAGRDGVSDRERNLPEADSS